MFGLGMGELVIILVIVVIIFGSTRLPMIGQGIGRGIKNFKKEVKPNEDKKNPENTETSDKTGDATIINPKDSE